MSLVFKTFLQELANAFQFQNLTTDEKGACLIIIKDGNIPLLFEFDEQLVPNTVLLSSAIKQIPIEYYSDVSQALLIANTYIEDTLSIKPDEEILYLHYRFHPSIQAADIESRIKIFLETSKEWKQKIEEMIKKPPQLNKKLPHPSSIQIFPYKA